MTSPRREAGLVTLVYLALTIALTWPLGAGLTRDIPGDFGDPLFSAWAMAWDATHLGRGWWNANIFAPQPLALAYSEHFLPQGIQAWPLYAATRNPLLGYNVVFLSTFVLSGLGMFLLARELTGSRAAGFIAGLAFAFSPFRIASIPHLQVLSSAWMPFTLYGLRRYFASGRVQPLAGAAGAWILQNLSCGYYLLFFSPVVLIYTAWEMTTRRLWTNRRALSSVAVAVAAVPAATIPFLLPYLELRRLGFNPRSLTETKKFSADVYAWFTADPNLRVWGPIATSWQEAEGVLFPGLTIVVLAVIGALTRSPTGDAARRAPAERGAMLHRVLLFFALACWAAVVALLLGWSIRVPGLRITELWRTAIVAVLVTAALLVASQPSRAAMRAWLASPAGIFSVITLFSVLMSLGPEIHAKGRTIAGTSLYAVFYHYVPGFDGVRVPARFAAIVTLGLAALAGLAVAGLERRGRRLIVPIAAALIVLEAIAVPIPINENSTTYAQAGLVPLPPRVATGDAVAPVYRFIAGLPADAVVLELPLGEPAFDIRYMFFSTTHWKRLVNGYSGGAPLAYEFLDEALKDVGTRPDRAWEAIAQSTATHAVVHEGSYEGERGRLFGDFFRAHGALEVAVFGTDRIFALPSPVKTAARNRTIGDAGQLLPGTSLDSPGHREPVATK
jgi:hypothetical protein